MQGISWIKAYGVSFIFHVIVILVVGLFIAGTVTKQEEKQMYVVDLDASNLESSGSGHAGGGGGGSSGSSGSSSLFPEKLSETQMQQKMAAVEQQEPLAQANHPQVTPPPDAVPTPDSTSSSAPAEASGGYSAPSSDYGGGSGGQGTGTGEGYGSGTGAGSGEGYGSGYGDGTGDGQGYGEGSGDGQGSGDSGASGTGTGAFDSDGFWAAVDANKVYPPMAVRRGLTGTVNVTVTLDASGNCIGISADGPSILAKAAENAVYAATPYPNATGQTITVNVPVTFNLQQ